jgi:hypothetical protein
MATAAEILFQSIASETDLGVLVHERREEGLYLEFKQKSDRRNGNIEEKEQIAFSKALSGFANADGGVLIFGVETKKGADGIDRAHSLKSILDHDRFRARLIDALNSYTQPLVEGVRIESIAGDENHGYVKCLIPASDRTPHRAMQAQREYWSRGAAGFRKMEHYEIADAFGRRLRPSLRLVVELRPHGNEVAEIHFYMLNEGRGVAKHSGMIVTFEGVTVRNVGGAGMQNGTSFNDNRPTVQFYDGTSVIHPNGVMRYLGHAVLQFRTADLSVLFKPMVFAEDMETKNGQILRATPGVKAQVL